MDPAFFRHSFGALVPYLCRKFGAHRLEMAEDAAQIALMRAVESWPQRGMPDEPRAWLFRVASNAMIDQLRHQLRQRVALTEVSGDPNAVTMLPERESNNDDSMVQTLCLACDPELPLQSQIAFSLRVLCGFDTREISARLMMSEANVHQRLSRARRLFQQRGPRHNWPEVPPSRGQIEGVMRTLYAIFSEGYHSETDEVVIRKGLCDEAIRLTTGLVYHTWGDRPDCAALLALMHLHRARLDARQDRSGALVLLEEQDRNRFDPEHVRLGLFWLHRSAEGVPTRWHAEAGIAAEHCISRDHGTLNWARVLNGYDMLIALEPSAMARLNRLVALAEVKGPHLALQELAALRLPTWLDGAYQVAAVRAFLLAKNGERDAARASYDTALSLAPSQAVRDLIARRRAKVLREISGDA